MPAIIQTIWYFNFEKSPPRLRIYRFLMYCAKNRVEEERLRGLRAARKLGLGYARLIPMILIASSLHKGWNPLILLGLRIKVKFVTFVLLRFFLRIDLPTR